MKSTKFKITVGTMNLKNALVKALADEYGYYQEEIIFEGTERSAKRKASELYDYFGGGGGTKAYVKALDGERIRWVKSSNTKNKWERTYYTSRTRSK